MTRQTKGIILQKRDFRENDRLFVIYTEDLGKIEAVCRGARKIKSKMAGHLDYFSVINFMFASGRNYFQIAGAETENNFLKIKADLAKVVLCSYCAEIVDIFTRTGQPDKKIFALVKELFTIFGETEKKNVLTFYGITKFFILKLLVVLGFSPELFYCVKCKNKIRPNKNFFNPILGGLVCESCHKTKRNEQEMADILISTSAIKILRFAAKNDFQKLLLLKTNKPHLVEVIKIINVFLLAHQDRELKSEAWVKKIIRDCLK